MKPVNEITEEEAEKLVEAMTGDPFKGREIRPEYYSLALKKKRLGGMLLKALRESGYEDVANKLRISRHLGSEEDL
jgi:hypothetical protein